MHKLIAAILHLGNIQFEAAFLESDPAAITSPPEVLAMVCTLLELPEDQLTEGMSCATIRERVWW